MLLESQIHDKSFNYKKEIWIMKSIYIKSVAFVKHDNLSTLSYELMKQIYDYAKNKKVNIPKHLYILGDLRRFADKFNITSFLRRLIRQ